MGVTKVILMASLSVFATIHAAGGLLPPTAPDGCSSPPIFTPAMPGLRLHSTCVAPADALRPSMQVSINRVVTAGIPVVNTEVRKNDVKVRVEDGVLHLSGERSFEKRGKRHHRVERAYGTFTRGFTLPQDADPHSVRAEFKDGVLKIDQNKPL
jgi:hypothetical protein